MRAAFRHLAIALAACCVWACKPIIPSEYIQPDDMEDILYDYHLAVGMANQGEKERSIKDKNEHLYILATFKKHGVTKAEFDSSMVYYMKHYSMLRDIYDNVINRLDKQAISMGASESEIGKYSAYNSVGDTANVWNGYTTKILSVHEPYNYMQFEIPADTAFHKGDAFQLNFNVSFLYQAGSKEGVAYMAVKYDNDSVISRQALISSEGNNSLSFPKYENHNVKEIRGFFYLGNSYGAEDATLKLMIVDNIQFIRFHNQTNQDEKLQTKEENNKTDSINTEQQKADADSSKRTPQFM